MWDAIPFCPRCGDRHVVRNGHTRAGPVNLLCRGCGRRRPITPEREELVCKLLLERVSLRGIARATSRSRSWLQRFANDLYCKQTLHAPGRLKNSPAT